jgi:hypothetical protein
MAVHDLAIMALPFLAEHQSSSTRFQIQPATKYYGHDSQNGGEEEKNNLGQYMSASHGPGFMRDLDFSSTKKRFL